MYKLAFGRWRESLKDAVWLEATTKTPLAIGLGNASPIENGLAIHHTYGVPYLPGSALKGLLRRVAERFGLSEQEKAVLLGEGPDPKQKKQGNAAYLVYWDGWLELACTQPFQFDVITVHHREYYGKKGAVWPTDFDDPNPVAFLSVRPGVKFWIPITCPAQDAQDWPYKAAEMLAWGLENLGLGGKTNAGYGYFTCDFGKSAEEEAREREESAKLLESLTPEIEKIQNSGSANKALQIARQLREKPAGVRKPILERLKQQLVSKNLWKEDKEYTKLIDKLLKDIKGGCK
ncbi:type III-B CRISPR module RAMP protein Cmr6 [Meiothermus sp.]|uniref:type III-B CRISPR module RAMP protein Cmr6 n=1 Tax=Meiothermus sp. TaxID=1955249 RepID=UPI00262CDCA1|nr:type III-B CRISPR module RAMP protein Cmr6 [Meiothermus sp.]